MQRKLPLPHRSARCCCARRRWPHRNSILVDAKVFTADPARPYAEAVAIEDGRFSAVGSNADIRALAGPATRIVSAGGRLVTPGLIEAHVHLGWNLPSPPLALPRLPFPGPSGEQVLAAVEAAAKTPGDWISAWIGPAIARDRRNWRNALDAVAPDRPVLLRGFWGHTTIINSAALKRLGIADDVPDPARRLVGPRRERAARWPCPRGGGKYRRRVATPATRRSWPSSSGRRPQRYARWGVTSIHLMNSGKSLDGHARHAGAREHAAEVDRLFVGRTPCRASPTHGRDRRGAEEAAGPRAHRRPEVDAGWHRRSNRTRCNASRTRPSPTGAGARTTPTTSCARSCRRRCAGPSNWRCTWSATPRPTACSS